jgi:hypothetical protein
LLQKLARTGIKRATKALVKDRAIIVAQPDLVADRRIPRRPITLRLEVDRRDDESDGGRSHFRLLG